MSIENNISNAGDRVKDLCNMGQNLGFSPMDWTVLLVLAAESMKQRFGFKIDVSKINAQAGEDCPCDKCTEKRRREGFHVVN